MSEKINELERKAESGNLDDMFNLAKELYRADRFEEAKKLFEKLAELGRKDAIEYLDYTNKYIENGREAIGVFYEAMKKAENGDASAMRHIGRFYMNGIDGYLMRDYKKSIEWYKKAAELGDYYSMHELGWQYFLGKNIEKNFEEAFEWFLKAAMQYYEDHGWGYHDISSTNVFSAFGVAYVMRQKKFQERLKYTKSIDELYAPLLKAYSSAGDEKNKKSGRK